MITTAKFEVATPFNRDIGSVDLFMLTDKQISLSWDELICAIELHKHKIIIKKDKCIGVKINEKGLSLLFER